MRKILPLLLVAFSASASADGVMLFCKPVKQAFMKKISKILYGIGDPVHCGLDYEISEDSKSPPLCRRATLIIDRSKRSYEAQPVIKEIPCAQMGLVETALLAVRLPLCDARIAHEAALIYGDTRHQFGANSLNDEIEPGYPDPHGYGWPVYCDRPFRRETCVTSNTYVKWMLEQCGVRMPSPHGAVGWEAIPTWYAPKHSGHRRAQQLWQSR
jgi:hypothetical protein